MDDSDRLRCLFSARIEQRDGGYFVEVPDQELRLGTLSADETYRIGVFSGTPSEADDAPEPDRERELPTPPVAEGEKRAVEIETIGDQGDGIARVERGYVVIVPDTEQGERVRIEITDVQQNVAFADVVERLSYYE